MEESSLFRAITIAVSVFVAIITISAVLSYYSTAKALVQGIGTGIDYNESYSDYVEGILLKGDANSYITGTDVINLVNYFYKNEKVNINITSMTPLYVDNRIYPNLFLWTVTLTNVNNEEEDYNKYISRIMPSEKFNITRRYENGILRIDIRRIRN